MEHAKHWADAASLMTAIATVAGWMPQIAALFSIIWTTIRIYETKTFQGWINRWRK